VSYGKTTETSFRSDDTFTQAEFLTWLDANEGFLTGRCELLDGSIVMSPPARYPHGDVTTTLVIALGVHVASRELGRVYESSIGYELPSGDTLEPDVSFVSESRYAKGPAPEPGQMLRVVPDLVVEVLSPSTAARDLNEKKRVYAKNGVSEYWIVDPRRRLVVVHALGELGYDSGTDYATGSIRSLVLPDLALTVGDVFARLDHT
jgi:Uma2 family endonuclease